MAGDDALVGKHGGFRRLKTFQLARLIYDVTVRFCDLFIDPHSRTHDQMVQAARSGVQNIAEGSQDSGTSRKLELKLTNIARGSLEELRLDYEDFLRQRGLPRWAPDHPALVRFKAARCCTLQAVREWVGQEVQKPGELEGGHTDSHRLTRTDTDRSSAVIVPAGEDAAEAPVSVCDSPCESVTPRSKSVLASVLVANAALSLLNLCCYLLDRQIAAQAETFEREGGFTERMYRIRSQRRKDLK